MTGGQNWSRTRLVDTLPGPDWLWGCRVFEMLGIDPEAVSVYRALLLNPHAALADVAAELSLSEDQLRCAIDVLSAHSLLRKSQIDAVTIRPISPDVALGSLLADLETDLVRRREELRRLRVDVATFAEDYRSTRDATTSAHLELLDNRDSVLTRLGEMNLTVRSETVAFVTNRPTAEALEQARPGDTSLLERGITIRNLYLDSVRNSRENMTYLRWFHDQGAQLRTVPTLPVRMIVHDRRMALVAHDPEDPGLGAVLIRGAGMLAALNALVDDCWDSGEPLFEDARRDDAPLTRTERNLLRMLGSGNKDEAVARKLGVSVRTARRTIAQLSERLGAESRFELGARAVKRGWL
mgnify:CR=1 FL=1